MKKWLVAALSAAAVVTTAASAQASGTGSAGDDQAAFNRILRQQQDAWFHEDGRAFAETFTTTADLVTFNGDHLRTRDGIAKGMQYYFDKYIDHNHIKVLDETVQYAGGDLVFIVRTTCLVQPPDTDCRDGSLSRNTNTLVRRHGTWLQQSFQNTRVVSLP